MGTNLFEVRRMESKKFAPGRPLRPKRKTVQLELNPKIGSQFVGAESVHRRVQISDLCSL